MGLPLLCVNAAIVINDVEEESVVARTSPKPSSADAGCREGRALSGRVLSTECQWQD
jgi:hypothetical protein